MAASFFQTYKAEGIKLKNTYIYWLAIILSLIIPVFYIGFQLYELKEYNERIYPDYQIFEIVFDDLSGSFLGFFFLIILILSCSRLAQLDFKNNTWQLIETLPVSKFNIYFSKIARILSILVFSLVCVIVVSIFTALILYIFIDAKENISLELPFKQYLQYLTKGIIASLFAVSVLFLISTRFSNFIFTMLFGFGLIIGAPILKALGKLPRWEMFTLITNVTDAKSQIGNWFTYSDYTSIVLAIPFLVIGFFWYKDHTFKQAFLKNKKQLLVSILSIVFGVAMAYYIQKPIQQIGSDKTVVKGEIKSPLALKNVYLVDPSIKDTLGVAAIKDNMFSMEIKKELPLGRYHILLDNKIGESVYMSTNDNIIFNYSKVGNNDKTQILGTRIAENSLNVNPFNFKSVARNLEDNHKLEDHDRYFKDIEAEYNDNIENMITTYTPDNYIPRNDFIDLNKKNIAVSTLLLYNKYQEKYELAFNKDLPENKFISDLEKTISLNDNTLVNNKEYAEYIKLKYIAEDTSDLDDETKFINAVTKLKNSDFKDRLVFTIANEAIASTKDLAKIVQIENQFSNQFLNPKVTQNFKQNAANAKRMALGENAPDFTAVDANGKQISLHDLKGKLVVLDVWATWCAPCKYYSPKFDKTANSFKNNDQIVFVALSIDEKIDKWLVDVKNKKVNVMQLHAGNIDLFSKLYNINSIPRFILIGKNGELINSSMPFPDTDEFEIEIKKHVNN